MFYDQLPPNGNTVRPFGHRAIRNSISRHSYNKNTKKETPEINDCNNIFETKRHEVLSKLIWRKVGTFHKGSRRGFKRDVVFLGS
jgi:hypothetical protein